MTRYASALVIVLAILPASCGGGGDGEPADTTTETDSPVDTGPDTPVDTPQDTQPDTEPDTAEDTAPDTEPDSAADTEEEDGYTPSDAAEYFCDSGYQPVCGYGTSGHFANRDECLRAYDSWTMAQQICAGNALGSSDCDTATDPPTPCP